MRNFQLRNQHKKCSFIGDSPGEPGIRKCKTASVIQTAGEFNRQTPSEDKLTVKYDNTLEYTVALSTSVDLALQQIIIETNSKVDFKNLAEIIYNNRCV